MTSPAARIQSGPRFRGLLRGYRFLVCESAADVTEALDVRRRVYVGRCGYSVPIPDAYDCRSWLLLARHVESGRAVGSLRITPRTAGPLELEEYIRLPPTLANGASAELTRFSIVEEPTRRRVLPAVAMGLFKLASQFLAAVGIERLLICSRPDRAWSYRWLEFRPTGVVVDYGALGGVPHELLICDLRHGLEPYRSNRLWDFFAQEGDPEIELPSEPPVPGLGVPEAPEARHAMNPASEAASR